MRKMRITSDRPQIKFVARRTSEKRLGRIVSVSLHAERGKSH